MYSDSRLMRGAFPPRTSAVDFGDIEHIDMHIVLEAR